MCKTQHVVQPGPIKPNLGCGGRSITRLKIAEPCPLIMSDITSKTIVTIMYQGYNSVVG